MRAYFCLVSLLVSCIFLGQYTCRADNTYRVTSIGAAHLTIPQETPLDTAPFTPDVIKRKMKQSEKDQPGKIILTSVKGRPEMRILYSGENLFKMGMQQGNLPEAIYLEKGHATLAQINSAYPKLLVKEEGEGNSYLCRRPLIVGRDASLSVENCTLKLSEERGAILVNAGKIFLVDSALTGWRETANGPAIYSGDKKRFRPFFISWGGSESYFCNVMASHLGYFHTKSFGISFSTYLIKDDEEMFQDKNFNFTAPPQGWIINSTFQDIYYGFYCYEAKDLVIFNNTYTNNIIYGIDPHDRSSGLIIANNRVSGTKVKHGIIMSRDVTNSFIIGNESYNNKISGIMLDRNCIHNEIAHNILYKNGGDGLSFYESGKNLVFKNTIMANTGHGIRLRNSGDITMIDNAVLNNKKFGIYLHTRDLSTTKRNIQYDPYSKIVSGTLIGGTVSFNQSGSLFLTNCRQFTLYNVLIKNREDGELRLGGELKQYTDQVIYSLSRNDSALLLTRYYSE